MTMPWDRSSAADSKANAASPPMNRAAVDSGIYMMRRAVDEDARGNPDTAYDLVFAALDLFLFALPMESQSAERQLEIQAKLLQIVDRIARLSGQYPVLFSQVPAESAAATGNGQPASAVPVPTLYGATTYTYVPVAAGTAAAVADGAARGAGGGGVAFAQGISAPPPTLSDTIVQAAVHGAIALKQSPIPGAVTGALSLTLRGLQRMDNTYKLSDRLVSLGKAGVAKAIDVDRTYRVHQKVGDALLTGLSAVTQATIAYKNTPGYQPPPDQGAVLSAAPQLEAAPSVGKQPLQLQAAQTQSSFF